jgi:hypothetical protein
VASNGAHCATVAGWRTTQTIKLNEFSEGEILRAHPHKEKARSVIHHLLGARQAKEY